MTAEKKTWTGLCLGRQPSTTYTCPTCDFENTVLFERDRGEYKVSEVWVDNDDDGTRCVGCRRELDADAIYAAAQESVWEPE